MQVAPQRLRVEAPLARKPHVMGNFSRRGSRSSRLAVMAFLPDDQHTHSSSLDGKRRDGLPLSMYHPYAHLPEEGQVIEGEPHHAWSRVKTPIYTYEAKCVCCCGTGFIKNHANGRRASLAACLVCHGLGYVRCTTSRFAPKAGPDTHTLARPPAKPSKPSARPAAP